MSDLFQQVLEQVKKLSPEKQQALAEMIELTLEEREWDALTQKPGARAFHDALREELRQAEASGEVEDITGDNWV
jgi:hypothetical protein